MKKNIREAKNKTEKPYGLRQTEKVLNQAKKINNDSYSETEKRIKAFQKVEGNQKFKPVKREYSDEELDYRDIEEYGGQLSDIEYDGHIDEEFMERAREALEGSSRMGNETGEGMGNAEAAWHGSKDDHGKFQYERSKKYIEKKQASRPKVTGLGDDVEVDESKHERTEPKRSPYGKTKKTNKKKVKKESMENKKTISRLTWKNPFKGNEKDMNLIPESHKVDGKTFLMTDGNQEYKVRWEGTIKEGTAVILKEKNQKAINEEISKVKHLFNFNSKDGFQKVDVVSENQTFRDLMNKSKELFKG